MPKRPEYGDAKPEDLARAAVMTMQADGGEVSPPSLWDRFSC